MAENNVENNAEKTVEKKQENTVENSISVQSILSNGNLLEELLNTEEVSKIIHAEADKVRTQAALDKTDYETKLKSQQAQIDELTAFKIGYERKTALEKAGIPVEYWEFIQGATETEILANAEKLKSMIQGKIQQKVGTTANTKSTEPKSITKEQFSKMNYIEKSELYRTDRDLYNELMNN